MLGRGKYKQKIH